MSIRSNLIKRALRVSFDIINILTELALIVWPAIIIFRLQASEKRRAVFITVFACRLLYVSTINFFASMTDSFQALLARS